MAIQISKFKVAAMDLLPCYDEVQGQTADDVKNHLDEMQEEVVTTKYCILTTDHSVGYWTGNTEPEIGAKITLCVPTENGATKWEPKIVKAILESEELEA